MASPRHCVGLRPTNSGRLRFDSRLERFVSIKIMTCEATRAIKAGKADELAMLQKISSADQSHPGRRHVVKYYETFDLEGPHGTHCCIVTEPSGFSLHFMRSLQLSEGERFSPEDITDTIRHVLLALDYLHNSYGIIHTDIKFDNILYRPNDLAACITHVLLTIPSEAYRCDTRARPVAVPIVSQPITMYSPGTDIQNTRAQAVIADFSHCELSSKAMRTPTQSCINQRTGPITASKTRFNPTPCAHPNLFLVTAGTERSMSGVSGAWPPKYSPIIGYFNPGANSNGTGTRIT
ncbi:hypothetical protein ACGC1H_002148 [Rhizoctonia solani]